MLQSRKCIQNILPYQPGKPLEELKEALGLKEIYQLASNENPLGSSPAAVVAIRVSALCGARYPSGHSDALRDALCSRLGVSSDRLIFGAGSREILKLLCMAYLDPDDEMIVPRSSFGEYARYAAFLGAGCKSIPLNDSFAVDLPALAAAISSHTKMIVISNPNDPTGTVIDQRALRQMLHRIGSDLLVVLDESYFEYVERSSSPNGVTLQKEFPNIIALRTFSHAYGLAGLRIGYAVAHESVVREIDKVREPFHISAIAQAAALATLNDKEYLDKTLRYNRLERENLLFELRHMGLSVLDSQANFLFVDVKRDSVKVYQELLRRGVMIRSAKAYGYPTAIRVSVGLREENEAFLKALKEYLAQPNE